MTTTQPAGAQSPGDTPRTDAWAAAIGFDSDVGMIQIARTLERELGEAHKKYNDALIHAANAERYLSERADAAHAALAEAQRRQELDERELARREALYKEQWQRAEKAEAALAECQRDAARYRYLREGAYVEQVEYNSWYLAFSEVEVRPSDADGVVTPELVDQRVDSAMSSTGEGSGG